MNYIIIEVGSTVTKVDKYEDGQLKRIGTKTIMFKKNYSIFNKLLEEDLLSLYGFINTFKEEDTQIYVCGTSIFRKLPEIDRVEFLSEFKNNTGVDFNIISQSEESRLTILGTVRKVKQKSYVFIGGGGSTEVALYDKKIKKSFYFEIGVIDIINKFPDLEQDIATTSLDEVKEYIKGKINSPKDKSELMILAGGLHLRFAYNSGVRFHKNTIYKDSSAPIFYEVNELKQDIEKYFSSTSLDEIRSKSEDPQWWNATRAMFALVLVIADSIDAKYIFPTDISMAYGLLNDLIK